MKVRDILTKEIKEFQSSFAVLKRKTNRVMINKARGGKVGLQIELGRLH